MKEIKAIIQPFKLTHVLHALHAIEGLPAVTVSEARSINLERGTLEQATQVKLEIMVPDDKAEEVRAAIQEHARTGREGDGSIFVIPIEHSTDIRTGGAS